MNAKRKKLSEPIGQVKVLIGMSIRERIELRRLARVAGLTQSAYIRHLLQTAVDVARVERPLLM